ncbi:hypothetical protein [Acinetobacter calcoaceticus]|uniref:hypothetical protein n=1 Tax=Acinetobacter calcoaceticus TaxID=471 RepID=UPI00192AB2CB|nr:hypothetical protein [Acinetobacter calcoaceticus]
MPNLVIYISEAYSNQISNLDDLTMKGQALCVEVLKAEPSKIHIIYITVKHGVGHPIYAELTYRLSENRSSEVMEVFMKSLDKAILKTIGVKARIRCFGSPSTQLYAYN